MSFSDRDQEFERALLSSAQADDPPAETRAEVTAHAWSRFSAHAAVIGDALRGEVRSEGAAGTGEHARSAAVRRMARPMATVVRWRWLLVGALGGGVVTGALFVLRPPMKVLPQEVGAGEQPPPVPGRAPTLTVTVPVSPAPRIAERPAVRREARRRAQIGRASAEPTVAEAAPSTLAAEVAALDAARAAAAAGRFQEAVRLIGRYHYDYPMGELAADAEVIAIEALEADHDRPEMTRRAWRFVQQHPDDPHAARIKRRLVSQPPP
jgi:hypothetical protein